MNLHGAIRFGSVTSSSLPLILELASCLLHRPLGLTDVALNCPAGVSVNFATATQDPVTVTYGVAGSATTATANTTAFNYTVKTYTSPFLHSVNLCDLKPATEYKYTVGDFSASFVSPPATSADPTVIGLVGDTDLDPDSFNEMIQPVQNLTTQAIVIVGDYSYANGNHKIWDDWYNLQQPVFSKLPNVGINGNHETIVSSTGWDSEKYLGYLSRAATPITKANRDALRTYYSLNFGLVHLVFLDDYVGNTLTVGSDAWLAERQAQLDWFVADLDKVDRSKTPYVTVFKHNPFYNMYTDHTCQCADKIFEIPDKEACWRGNYTKATNEPQCGLQAKLEDAYAKYKVDVVFSGHVHGYERSEYIYQYKVNKEKGSIYVTTGAGGRGHAGTRIANVPSWNVYAEPAKFGASRIIATREKMQVYWFMVENATQPADYFEVRARRDAC
ncbi:hypothetical protein AeNC1_012447 [Aphanomyces euteiches]|nr:hypothetical protein AeNC1_012447 [Aphanomyces euteiches]